MFGILLVKGICEARTVHRSFQPDKNLFRELSLVMVSKLGGDARVSSTEKPKVAKWLTALNDWG
jgi:hypothetical protein